jgi:hypothetical protein
LGYDIIDLQEDETQLETANRPFHKRRELVPPRVFPVIPVFRGAPIVSQDIHYATNKAMAIIIMFCLQQAYLQELQI